MCDSSLNLQKKKKMIISVLLKIDEERAIEEKMWEANKIEGWIEYKKSDVLVCVCVCEAGSI